MGRENGETLSAAWKRADENTAVRNALRGPGGLSQEEFDKRGKELAAMHIFTDAELKEQRKKQVEMVQKICSGLDMTEEGKTHIWELFGFDERERKKLAGETLYQKLDSGPDVTEEEKTAIWASLLYAASLGYIPPPNSGGHRGRYLWTDAFGVLNFLTLHQELDEAKYLTLAKRLVASVHDILGRTRDGDSRLPGATDENPLGGGLRIGKEEASGPDGDGQYHHYLTIWMFALNRLSIASGMATYNDQAISLACGIHPRFFIGRTTSSPRMVWKISMDMTKPLVSSQGRLDATTGFVVFRLLQEAAKESHVLETEIADYHKVISQRDSPDATNDTLDLGMALWTAHWYAEKDQWLEKLGENCLEATKKIFGDEEYKKRTSPHRLAFREFGALMGARCYAYDEYMEALTDSIIAMWEKLLSKAPEDLRPITMVMYSAALLPTAFQRNGLKQQSENV
ncbi:hypothetical protein VE03_10133 [Pseudogymnoascus sp. 23342-1-I1]|nr:hypothetical protein VE03_10133 [Pseudogymnoascus sp. 23342-1-I1]